MTPDFSILHITARLPDGWTKAYLDWCEKCVRPEAVEYILVVDAQQTLFDGLKPGPNFPMPPPSPRVFGDIRLGINHGRRCTTDAWNHAAKISTGQILMCASDDWFPCDRWDEAIRRAVPDPSKEVCVWPAGELATAGLMIHPILTRAYYERPGRGGHPNGELFYPEYISVGNDDDFTEIALRDKVVVRIAEVFEHRHVSVGLAPDDDVYRWSNRQEAWDVKHRVIARRRAENYAR